MTRFLLLLVVVCGGCGDRKPSKPVRTERLDVSRALQEQVEDAKLRFTVEAQGYFEGGYEDHKREIFILTDTQTGKKYLTVTGAGVTELWTETETHTTYIPGPEGNVIPVTTTTTKTVEE